MADLSERPILRAWRGNEVGQVRVWRRGREKRSDRKLGGAISLCVTSKMIEDSGMSRLLF